MNAGVLTITCTEGGGEGGGAMGVLMSCSLCTSVGPNCIFFAIMIYLEHDARDTPIEDKTYRGVHIVSLRRWIVKSSWIVESSRRGVKGQRQWWRLKGGHLLRFLI